MSFIHKEGHWKWAASAHDVAENLVEQEIKWVNLDKKRCHGAKAYGTIGSRGIYTFIFMHSYTIPLTSALVRL